MTSRMNQIGQNGNDGLHYNLDTDLTWFARNVHEWKEGSDSVIMTSDKTIVEFVSEDNKPSFYTGPIYTKNQWLTRRAELQNKPNWEDAPERVEYMAQWSDGQWIGYEVKPERGNEDDPDACYVDPRKNPHIYYFSYGEVLGDWRNTLEKRPVSINFGDWKTTAENCPEKRELNPPTSSLHHTQAVEIATETGLCSDGKPLGEHNAHFDDYCDDCPNQPKLHFTPEGFATIDPADSNHIKQPRYKDSKGEDWIDECARTFTTEEFRGAMRFNIGKYNRRAGKKDELIKEIAKIKDYAHRWELYEKALLDT